jgi:hypothetical protein
MTFITCVVKHNWALYLSRPTNNKGLKTSDMLLNIILVFKLFLRLKKINKFVYDLKTIHLLTKNQN